MLNKHKFTIKSNNEQLGTKPASPHIITKSITSQKKVRTIY